MADGSALPRLALVVSPWWCALLLDVCSIDSVIGFLLNDCWLLIVRRLFNWRERYKTDVP
jgi:hypothetical protein